MFKGLGSKIRKRVGLRGTGKNMGDEKKMIEEEKVYFAMSNKIVSEERRLQKERKKEKRKKERKNDKIKNMKEKKRK